MPVGSQGPAVARSREDPGVIPPDEGGPSAQGEEGWAEDPDRVLRLRFVYALVVLLTGSTTAALFAVGVLAFSFSGRVDLLFAFASTLVALGVILLLVRAPLRALMALRPANDELRSLAGFVSLACGLVLLTAMALFLLFTFSVILSFGGITVLYLLPMAALAYLTLQFMREATEDFLKRVRLRRELRLLFVTLAYFVVCGLLFQLLAAASVASPIVLRSPPDGSVIRPGTVLDFDVTDRAVVNVTWTNGSGGVPLPAPYDLPTDGWAEGNHTLELVLKDEAGGSHSVVYHFIIDSTPPSIAAIGPSNNSVVPAGTPLNFSLSDAHNFTASWSDTSGNHSLSVPYSISTTGWAPATYFLTLRARDEAGNEATLVFRVTLT